MNEIIYILSVILLWIISFVLPLIILINYRFIYVYLLVIISFKIFITYIYNKTYTQFLLNKASKYYSLKIINEPKISDNKNLIACFPHGIFTQGFFIFSSIKLDYIKFVSSVLINTPLMGDFLKKHNILSADKKTFINIMKKEKNMSLLPGGFNEFFMTTKYEYNLYIPTGFIALCIKNEYNIYPCLFLGENEIYDTSPIPKRYWLYIIKFIKIINIPLNFIYSIVPNRVPIHIIYGEKIECNKLDSIEETREKIKNQLISIFNSNIKEYCKLYNFDHTKYKLNIYY